MILDSLVILLPLIFLASGGYLLTLLFQLSESTLIRIVTDFFMPILVFYSLYTSTIVFSQTLKLLGVVSLILFILFIASFIYCKVFDIDFKSFSPPILFMNSGFLGIPLMKIWGGVAAMNYIVVYDQIQTFYIFTLGIVIVTGGFTNAGLKEMVKSPLLWSIVAGFVFKYLHIPVSDTLLEIFSYSGAGAPALATFALGCSLSKRKIKADPHLIAGLLLRFGVGFLAGIIACMIFNISGTERTVILIASSLPSAVFSVVMPMRYGVDGRFASSMILISSILSIFILPLLFTLSASFN
jgi:malate permease and related proteins